MTFINYENKPGFASATDELSSSSPGALTDTVSPEVELDGGFFVVVFVGLAALVAD